MLITPDTTNGLPQLFKYGEEIATYKRDDHNDAAEKIRYYLAHEEERLAIARRGFAKVREKHTSKSRARELETILSSITVTSRPQKYAGCASSAITSYLVAKQEKLGWGGIMLQSGAASYLRAVNRRETRASDFVGLGVLYRHFLLEAGYADQAMVFSGELAALDPNINSFKFSHLQALLDCGKVPLAHEMARNWGYDSERLLSALTAVLTGSLAEESR